MGGLSSPAAGRKEIPKMLAHFANCIFKWVCTTRRGRSSQSVQFNDQRDTYDMKPFSNNYISCMRDVLQVTIAEDEEAKKSFLYCDNEKKLNNRGIIGILCFRIMP